MYNLIVITDSNAVLKRVHTITISIMAKRNDITGID